MTHKFLFSIILAFFCFSFAHFYLTDKSEVLVLFVDQDQATISQVQIDSLQQLTEQMNIDFVVKQSNEGLPQEITTLPSIYFQNRKGRSKYYGRYNNYSRIQNFVRTSKLAHQQDAANEKTNVLVWKNGKADITAPLKMTELTGVVPEDFEQEAFEEEALNAIASTMTKFKLLDKHSLSKHSKSFYFNIYPYLNKKKQLSLTTEIFSQYNCVKPIYTQSSPPIATAKWAKRAKAFAKAGQVIEAEILRQIESSTLGDDFTAVAMEATTASWEDLGLNIENTSTQKEKTQNTKVDIPQKWQVEKRQDDEPIIIFSFLSPVDNYAGEVKALTGALELAPNLSMQNAKGKFHVNISDVTMGAEDFDYEVQNKMLQMNVFPNASFEFLEVLDAPSTPLQIGVPQKMLVKGQFTMLGISTPIEVNTDIEAFVDEKEEVKLQVNCTFQLPLFDKFKLDGPDGPSPAKDNLQFYMKFNLETI